jgi:hypothetical protein
LRLGNWLKKQEWVWRLRDLGNVPDCQLSQSALLQAAESTFRPIYSAFALVQRFFPRLRPKDGSDSDPRLSTVKSWCTDDSAFTFSYKYRILSTLSGSVQS